MIADDERCVNTIRVISAAQPEAARSGHPGAPMGCAPIGHLLYGKVMRFNPEDPSWIARDRFVLSNGHGCALQYTMLHLLGFDISLEDLKNFRQLDGKTPGHPERGHTAGVEVTSGPLGQGISQAVGLALGGRMMAAKFNRPSFPLFEDFVYGILGDGCLQEGVSSEASSLAGHWGLGNLIFFYDSNGITIDGSTELSFTEDVGRRYEAYGWQVLRVGNVDCDFPTLEAVLQVAKACKDKPSLIICSTTIGFGSKIQGLEKAHGAPLGAEDLANVRKKFGLPEDMWAIEDSVKNRYSNRKAELKKGYSEWQSLYSQYKQEYPELAAELAARCKDEIPSSAFDALPKYTLGDKALATRAFSGLSLNAAVAAVPWIVGGSADLQGSTSVALKGHEDVEKNNFDRRYIRFGVREHGMIAITVGLAAYGGFRPFCSTFSNFITYGWGAVRIACLSNLPILLVATHDSIELGEDGPTHQPIEVAALCRAMPNMLYIRPCDGNETSGGYAVWMKEKTTPVVLALSRNAVPILEGTEISKVALGAYVLSDWNGNGGAKILLAGCGTEMKLLVEAAKLLRKENFDIRIVSFPCWQLFMKQSKEYQESVFPKEGCKKLYVEAANTLGCERWFDASIGMTTFGASAPLQKVFEKYGFTVDNITSVAKRMLQ